MHRLSLAAGCAASILLGVSACGGASTAGSTPTASRDTSASTAAPASTTYVSASPSASASASASAAVSAKVAPDLATANLASLLAPAPAGFTVSHQSGDLNGTMTAAEFDSLTASGEATTLGFRTGQSVTYGDGLDEVEYDLIRLSSAADAAQFLAQAGGGGSDDPTKSVLGTDRAIPGSVTSSPTVDDGTDSIEYDLFARVGATIMITSYYPAAIDATGTSALEGYAKIQYGLIT